MDTHKGVKKLWILAKQTRNLDKIQGKYILTINDLKNRNLFVSLANYTNKSIGQTNFLCLSD